MDPLLLAGGLLLLAKALTSKSSEPAAPSSPPRDAGDVAAGIGKAVGAGGAALAALGGGGGTAGVGGAAAGAAGAVAYGAINAGLGFALTGDAWGAAGALASLAPAGGWGTSIGSIGISSGNVGNVGRVLGREIDKLLGGTGNGATGVTYQVTGYLGGLLVASWGIAAIPFVGQIFLIVVGIGSAISDANRLAYGQQGAIADASAAARELLKKTHASLVKSVQAAFGVNQLTPEDEQRLLAHAMAFTVGYMTEDNAAKERAHNASPPGLGQGAEYHQKWALDRGVFIAAGVQAYIDDLFVLIGGGDQLFTQPKWIRELLPQWQQALQQGKALYASSFSESGLRDGLEARGQFASNVTHYLLWMKETWGLGQSGQSHAAHGLYQVKAFTGGIDNQGNLVDFGQLVDWQQSVAAGKPVLR